MDSGRLQPALYGGLFIGVLSALPIVKAGNCCCCLWVIAGGALAVYLRQRNSPFAVTASEGALMGLLAGAIGGVLAAIIAVPLMAVSSPVENDLILRLLSRSEIDPVMRDRIEDLLRRNAEFGLGRFAVTLVTGAVIDAVFGLFGGLLGVAMFKKQLPPPPPPGGVQVLPPE